MANDKDVRFYRRLFDLRQDRETTMTDAHIDLCVDLGQRHRFAMSNEETEKTILSLMSEKESLVRRVIDPSSAVTMMNNIIYNYASSRALRSEPLDVRTILTMMHLGHILHLHHR